MKALGNAVDVLAGIEARARAAQGLAELQFSVANDAYGILGFRQALVFAGEGPQARLQVVSGLARPAEDSPYLVWLRRAWAWLHAQVADAPGWFVLPEQGACVPPAVLDGWREWWPDGIWAQPLCNRTGGRLGWVLFLLEQPPSEGQQRAVARLADTWGYCWEMLEGDRSGGFWKRHGRRGRWRRWAVLAALAAALAIPVRQTALAPAEVIAQEAEAIAAPLDGVVKRVHVRPNQRVRAGEPLFSLDDTTLRNRLEVAQQSVAVADAELQSATQKAFDSFQSKSDLALLTGRARERRAELAAVQAQLARIEVVAPRDGVAIFGDPDDWLGRPVSTGERIMLLADASKPGVLIYLPVADAVALEPGATLRLFLTVMPLSPLDARVTETSYQAVLSPDGVASYRLRAAFDEQAPEQARIGLRGTARLHAGRVPLGYYLLRRPLATLREWSGW